MRAISLRLDWCSYDAARHACLNWHYSGSMPAGKTVKIGAWESNRFIGAVVFGRGASPHLLDAYQIRANEGCELTRVALRDHQTSVTRILAIALRMLKRHCPGLRLVVSFADPMRDHIGTVYQGGNWLYSGASKPCIFYRIHGRLMHPRSTGRTNLNLAAVPVLTPGKHRYLWPFDSAMRDQLLPLIKPYPKRAKAAGNQVHHLALGGATPTRTLQHQFGASGAAI